MGDMPEDFVMQVNMVNVKTEPSDPIEEKEIEPSDPIEEKEIVNFFGRAKSDVWNYYGFYAVNGVIINRQAAVCKLCRKITKYVGNTTNLRNHLMKAHADVPLGYVSCATSPAATSYRAYTSSVSSPSSTSFLSNTYASSCSLDAATLTYLVRSLLVPNEMTLDILKEFVLTVGLDKKLPSVEELKSQLDTKYEEIIVVIKDLLRQAEYTAFTAELWKHNSDGDAMKMTVTAHFADESLKVRSCTLKTSDIKCDVLKAPDIADVRSVFSTIKAQWNLEASAVTANIDFTSSHIRENIFPCFNLIIESIVEKLLDVDGVKACIDCIPELKTQQGEKKSLPDICKSLVQKLHRIDDPENVIKSLIEVLSPIETVCQAICENDIPLVSMIFPLLVQIKKHISKSNDLSSLEQQMRNVIVEEIDRYIGQQEVQELLLVATALDARFKRLVFLNPKKKKVPTATLR